MATALALDASPTNVLGVLHGEIVDARIAYPHVLHIEVRDSQGGVWRLATQDADWSPSDPTQAIGLLLERADIDEESAELRCELSDGSALVVKPAGGSSEDDPPNWELISPTGIALEFGPGVRWQISAADAAVSSRR
jgi:hypothetical protein